MRSRWDMQAHPPDILITNYSMLNIMLMRNVEATVFTKTREWIESNSGHQFTIVVDELHLYRGTPGTEVALLLRNLLLRLGLVDRPDQVRFVATSASIVESQESREFLSEFFGVEADRFEIIRGEEYIPPATGELADKALALANFSERIAEPSNSEEALQELVNEAR